MSHSLQNIALPGHMISSNLILFLKGLTVFSFLSGFMTLADDSVRSGSAMNGARSSSENGSNARLVHVSTAIITSANDSEMARNYSGTVVAKRTSELGFKRIGRIVRLQVDQGDLVEEGQLICELDTAQIEAQMAILRAQRNAATARLDELKAGPRKQTMEAAKSQLIEFSAMRDQFKATFERRSRLANSDAISTQDIDDARHQLAAADARVAAQKQIVLELEEGTRKEQITAQEAEVSRLDASIEAMQVELEESQLRAPFKGIIAKRFLDEGTIVQSGQAIYRLIETHGLEAFIGLPVDAAQNLDSDRKYSLSVNGIAHAATLKAVLPELDAGTRTRTAIFSILPTKVEAGYLPTAGLSPGQVIQLRLTRKVSQEGFWIPMSALTKSINGLWSVYTVRTDSERQGRNAFSVERTDVEIIQIDTARVLVRGAINDGDRVVVDGVQKITPGQEISFTDKFEISEPAQ